MEPVNLINTTHLNRAASGMCERLRGALPDVRVTLLENVMQFVWNGATVQCVADAFWAHPNVVCWFVHVTHTNGNFQYSEGTPNPDMALLDIGRAMQFANEHGDKPIMER